MERTIRTIRRERARRSAVEERKSSADLDRESITGVHIHLGDLVERASRTRLDAKERDTDPPKRKGRAEIHPPTSLRPNPGDGRAMRIAKLALGAMHRHQRGWLVFVVLLIATVVLAILVVQGRITLLRDYVEPPRREAAPWNDDRHERRRPRRGEPVAPGTVE